MTFQITKTVLRATTVEAETEREARKLAREIPDSMFEEIDCIQFDVEELGG